MPERQLKGIHKRAGKAVADGRSATIHSVFVELQVGLAYCQLATTATIPSWKTRYRYSARTALSQALRLAAHIGLESEGEIYDEFVAAATLLQCALAKLDAERNSLTHKNKSPKAKGTRNTEGKVRTTCLV